MAEEIEGRWQRVWKERGTFKVAGPGEAGFDGRRPKFYALDMFPYPSGAGLHVGHPEGYTATDIVCRYKRMTGCNVLHPMGWDAFGLPAEQYAIQTGVHPAVTTRRAIETFRRQLQRFGFCYDWSREFATIDPEYYRWTQWIFLQVYNAWYDREQDRARPIGELVEGLERGRYGVDVFGEVAGLGVEQAVAPAITGEAVGVRRWHELTQEERRAFIDRQRLAYVDEQVVNWCPKLGTALANEEVVDGRSERGGFPVLRKPLKQWMFRITAYAERLLRDLALVSWPESTRTQQTEWIGRSEGALIDFDLAEEIAEYRSLQVYTTRPDTMFGATYMVIAPEHPLVERIVSKRAHAAETAGLKAYVREARNRSDVDRMAETKEKTGVYTGVNAINPATGKAIPVWVADYVLMGYGTGAIMAVPGQDQRDWDFAERFGLPIVRTVRPPEGFEAAGGKAYTGEGQAINSEFLDGMEIGPAKARMIEWLEEKGIGSGKVVYRLRDWLFSRQRYWGEPFPIVWDAAGNHYPVGEGALPVVLPELADYQPEESEEPRPLLAKATAWAETTAGAAGVSAEVLAAETPVRRELNTMPGWAGSCWYYLRYCDPKNQGEFISEEAERYWMGEGEAGGVDLYIGGSEHAVLHLLYSRFWHKVLFDLGHVSTPEPFKTLFHQGLITAYSYQRGDKTLVPTDQVEEVSEGAFVEKATGQRVTQVVAKMSKSLKNVVNPDDVIAQYGADTFRLYEMYMGPLDASKPWNTRDMIGLFRFLQRVWRNVVDEGTGAATVVADEPDEATLRLLHKTIAGVRRDIEGLAFNTAIAKLIEFNNHLTTVVAKGKGLARKAGEGLILMLCPFAPHIAEELWSRLGYSRLACDEAFPVADMSLAADSSVEIPIQIMGKVRGKIVVAAGADAKAIEAAALEEPKIQELLAGKTVQRVVVVPGKMVNIVAK
ncbi:MAG: leucine--tRNA ligase [Phycisphaeraceae bacterium]|nr:leucine--tRNA ligase [Phycisphaeraceae bacterium]